MKNKTSIIEIKQRDGHKLWYLNNKLQYEDEPTVENINDNKLWYRNDKLHHESGAIIENSYGTKYWLIDGTPIREKYSY